MSGASLDSWLAGATISAPMRRVLVHEDPLLAVQRPLLEQDAVADADLADVVEQAGPLDLLDLGLGSFMTRHMASAMWLTRFE